MSTVTDFPSPGNDPDILLTVLLEPPLVVSPTLAKLCGLNEAIFIRQLHYWLERSEHVRDGRRWVYNTYAEWRAQFPWSSDSTIRRTVARLVRSGVVLKARYNTLATDQTTWYSLDYGRLRQLILESLVGAAIPYGQTDQFPCGQNDHMDVVKMTTCNESNCTDVTRDYSHRPHTIDYQRLPPPPPPDSRPCDESAPEKTHGEGVVVTTGITAAAGVQAQLIETLHQYGINDPTAGRIADLPWVTPGLIEREWQEILQCEGVKSQTGLLVTRLRNHKPEPVSGNGNERDPWRCTLDYLKSVRGRAEFARYAGTRLLSTAGGLWVVLVLDGASMDCCTANKERIVRCIDASGAASLVDEVFTDVTFVIDADDIPVRHGWSPEASA